MHDERSHGRRLATLLRGVLREETFDSLADVVDALKFACARYHVSWTNDQISEALRLVGSNQPLLRETPKTKPLEPTPYPKPPQTTAVGVLVALFRRNPDLRARMKARGAAWPKPRRLTAEDIERFKTENRLITHGHRPAHVAPLPVPDEGDDE